MNAATPPPLVVHVIHRLGVGGLENGLVNIINRCPPQRYRHAIVCLTEDSGFARRITTPGVRIVSLHRGEGHSFRLYWTLWRTLARLRPAVVHTRNLSTLEAQLPAFFLIGVRRVHGEHGRDVFDLHGRNRKYNLLRRALRPLVDRYIAVSRDLAGWLAATVGVAPARIRQIYNGVDRSRFFPGDHRRVEIAPPGFLPEDGMVVGTVGRLAAVKDQASLVTACARLVGARPDAASRLRLVIVGDGPEGEAVRRQVEKAGLSRLVWFAGERDDVAELLRLFDVFVLPSLGEGVSNTILEAMATSLPVVATRVGGNPELVEDGINGFLVPVQRPEAITEVLGCYLDAPGLRREHGRRGLRKVCEVFDWDRCVAEYLGVYDELLGIDRGTRDLPDAQSSVTAMGER